MTGEEILERQKLCYQQNFEQFRALNAQMNRIPTLSVTITGGLWFGAALHEIDVDPTMRFFLLYFAGLSNLALIVISFRIRDVMSSYLEKIAEFHKPGFVNGQPQEPLLKRANSYFMIRVYCFLMGLAAAMSFVGAFFLYRPSVVVFACGVTVLVIVLVSLIYVAAPQNRPI